jgi:hypothetical protein
VRTLLNALLDARSGPPPALSFGRLRFGESSADVQCARNRNERGIRSGVARRRVSSPLPQKRGCLRGRPRDMRHALERASRMARVEQRSLAPSERAERRTTRTSLDATPSHAALGHPPPLSCPCRARNDDVIIGITSANMYIMRCSWRAPSDIGQQSHRLLESAIPSFHSLRAASSRSGYRPNTSRDTAVFVGSRTRERRG